MTIFRNNLKRILRKKTNWIFLIIVPALMAAFIGGVSGTPGMLRVAVADLDNTVFTERLIEAMEAYSRIRRIEESEIQEVLFRQTRDFVFILESGFTEGLLKGLPVPVRTMSLEETDISHSFRMRLDAYVNAAVNIAEVSGGDLERFLEGMDRYAQGVFSVSFQTLERDGGRNWARVSIMGFVVMSMLFLAGLSSAIMLEDIEKKVYYRVAAGPLKQTRIMLENVLSFFAVCILQILLVFTFLQWFLGVDFGPNLPAMLTVSLVFSLTAVALGVAVNTAAKNTRQAGLLMSLLITPMCMLGGCWWPYETMPQLLQRIGQFVPTTWIMRAYQSIIFGGGLSAAGKEMLVLSAFALVFLLFAAWRRIDVAK